MNEFHGSFVLQYENYCKARNLIVPDNEQIEKWKDNIINEYSTGTEQRVCAFFAIPKEYNDKVSKREYEIVLDKFVINNSEKIVIYNLTLKFK